MSGDSVSYREATPSDLPHVERLFRDEGSGPDIVGWTEWKYRGSPDGGARIFLAEEAREGLVGTVAYVPRRFALPDGSTRTIMQVVDVLVRSDRRNRGIYSHLADFARAQVEEPRFGFPNARSRRFTIPRWSWKVIGQGEQWSFPANAGGLVAAPRAQIMSPLVDAASRMYASSWLRRPRGIQLEPVRRFDTDYEIPGVIHGIRSARYLNWRFLDCPIRSYQAFNFRRQAEDLGYCVYTIADGSVHLSDFVAPGASRACMRSVVDHSRALGLTHVVYRGVGLRLWRYGFIRRKVYGDFTGDRLPRGRWHLTNCDCDAEVG